MVSMESSSATLQSLLSVCPIVPWETPNSESNPSHDEWGFRAAAKPSARSRVAGPRRLPIQALLGRWPMEEEEAAAPGEAAEGSLMPRSKELTVTKCVHYKLRFAPVGNLEKKSLQLLRHRPLYSLMVKTPVLRIHQLSFLANGLTQLKTGYTKTGSFCFSPTTPGAELNPHASSSALHL